MPSDHGNHYLTIGPDNMIYFNLGAPFNIGSPVPAVGTRDLNFATIARMTSDGRNVSTFATGLPLTHLYTSASPRFSPVQYDSVQEGLHCSCQPITAAATGHDVALSGRWQAPTLATCQACQLLLA